MRKIECLGDMRFLGTASGSRKELCTVLIDLTNLCPPVPVLALLADGASVCIWRHGGNFFVALLEETKKYYASTDIIGGFMIVLHE